MAIVAGVDFGTLSVRVSIVDSRRGRIGSGAADYPLHRKKEDPDHATQSHADHLRALAEATARALKDAGVSGDQVQALAIDTTGSTIVPVGEGLDPADYVLAGGGFPVAVKGAGVIGAICVSGLPERQDHEVIVAALCKHFGLDAAALALGPVEN